MRAERYLFSGAGLRAKSDQLERVTPRHFVNDSGAIARATPALQIALVAGFAGLGRWLSFLIATIGAVLVASNIGVLAKRFICGYPAWTFVKDGKCAGIPLRHAYGHGFSAERSKSAPGVF